MIYDAYTMIFLTQFDEIQDSISNLSCDAMRIQCDFEFSDEKQMRNIAVEGVWWSERSSIVFESSNFSDCDGRAAANQSTNWPRFLLDLPQQKLDATCRLKIHKKCTENPRILIQFLKKFFEAFFEDDDKRVALSCYAVERDFTEKGFCIIVIVILEELFWEDFCEKWEICVRIVEVIGERKKNVRVSLWKCENCERLSSSDFGIEIFVRVFASRD